MLFPDMTKKVQCFCVHILQLFVISDILYVVKYWHSGTISRYSGGSFFPHIRYFQLFQQFFPVQKVTVQIEVTSNGKCNKSLHVCNAL